MRQIRKMENGDTVALLWVFLLCAAGEINDGGAVYFTEDIPYDAEMLGDQFGMPPDVIKAGLEKFKKFGMIEIDKRGVIRISGWEKWQSTEKAADTKEKNRVYQQRSRARRKADQEDDEESGADSDAGDMSGQCQTDVRPMSGDVMVMCQDVSGRCQADVSGQCQDVSGQCQDEMSDDVRRCQDTEKRREEKREKRIDKNRSEGSRREGAPPPSSPPTDAEVSEYIRSRGGRIDARKFCDYYGGRGWKQPNGQPLDWKQSVERWENTEYPGKGGAGAEPEETANTRGFAGGSFTTDNFFESAVSGVYGDLETED